MPQQCEGLSRLSASGSVSCSWELYRTSFLEGVLGENAECAVVQRFALQNFRPCLYRKYLYNPRAIEQLFNGEKIATLGLESFPAYKWPNGQEIVYGLFTGRKG